MEPIITLKQEWGTEGFVSHDHPSDPALKDY